ncbi:MAG: serine hydrolase domain-containing protein [Bacteroidales bacterium]|nr:serine hydrolase domain-containing protein [Bacteroidales bacterium]
MYKQFYNIHRTHPVEVTGIQKHLHNPGSGRVIRQIAAEAVTVINNKNHLLPLRRPDTMRIAAVATGVGEKQVFQDYLDFYGPVTHFFTGKSISDDERDDLLEKLKDYDLILLSVHNTSSFPFRDFGISESERILADSLAARQRVVLTIFGIPYALSQFSHPAKYDGLIVAYEDRPEMQQVSAQIIYGGMRAKGRMPVSVGAYPTHHGITTPKIRLSLHNHFDLGIKEKYIRKIDSIASDGIKKKAYPGCQILMARDGQVFYDKRFGHHTYTKKIPVKYNDLYDLASLTKIAATTLSIMELTEDSLINIDRRLSYYLPFLRHTNKSEMIIRDVMAHQAGLQAWIPYYVNTLLDDAPDSMIYRNHLTEKYNIRVAEDLFIHGDYRYQIFDTIAKSPLREPVEYKYSDIGVLFALPDCGRNS